MLSVYSNHLFVPAVSYEFMPLTSNIHSIKVFIIFSLYNKIFMQYTQENTVVDNMLPSQDALDLSIIGLEDLRTEIFLNSILLALRAAWTCMYPPLNA